MHCVNRLSLFAMIAVLLVWHGSASADLISTYPPLGPGAGTFGVGPVASETWGETITAPTDGQNVLTSFTFVSVNVPPSLPLRGYVYAWDAANQHATGSALFVSPVTNTPPGFDNVLTFNTGGINLVGGNAYVLFLSTSEFFSTQPATPASLRLAGFPYNGGALATLNNDGNTSQWTTTPWIVDNSLDLAFTANFASPAVPEPSSLSLFTLTLTSMAGWCWWHQRRKKRSQEKPQDVCIA